MIKTFKQYIKEEMSTAHKPISIEFSMVDNNIKAMTPDGKDMWPIYIKDKELLKTIFNAVVQGKSRSGVKIQNDPDYEKNVIPKLETMTHEERIKVLSQIIQKYFAKNKEPFDLNIIGPKNVSINPEN